MILISPSKNLDIKAETINYKFSETKLKKIKLLSDCLKGLSNSDLKSLMPISDKLVELNLKDLKKFNNPDNQKASSISFYRCNL